MPNLLWTARRQFLGWVILLGWHTPVQAQAFLRGIVREDSSGRPLEAVDVVVEGTTTRSTTDAQGRYFIGGLPSGSVVLVFRMVGYVPVRSYVLLKAGDTARANAALTPRPQAIDSILVVARPDLPEGEGREAFGFRRRLGFGRFYDSSDLRRNEHLRLADLLRRKGGVAVVQRVIDGARLTLAYHPTRRDNEGNLDCPMQIYLNGAKVGAGGREIRVPGGFESGRFVDLTLFDIPSLESVEVYSGASEIPAAYSGPTADCGVILLWTR